MTTHSVVSAPKPLQSEKVHHSGGVVELAVEDDVFSLGKCPDRAQARARSNWASQGQRCGRCSVRWRAERVIRPAREKNRRRRVLVVTTCFVGVSGVGAGIKSKQVFVPSVQPIVAEPGRLVGWSLESKNCGILGALRIDRRREPGERVRFSIPAQGQLPVSAEKLASY